MDQGSSIGPSRVMVWSDCGGKRVLLVDVREKDCTRLAIQIALRKEISRAAPSTHTPEDQRVVVKPGAAIDTFGAVVRGNFSAHDAKELAGRIREFVLNQFPMVKLALQVCNEPDAIADADVPGQAWNFAIDFDREFEQALREHLPPSIASLPATLQFSALHADYNHTLVCYHVQASGDFTPQSAQAFIEAAIHERDNLPAAALRSPLGVKVYQAAGHGTKAFDRSKLITIYNRELTRGDRLWW